MVAVFGRLGRRPPPRPGGAFSSTYHGPSSPYTVFTGRNSPEGFAATHDCFVRYYRSLLMLEAAGERR